MKAKINKKINELLYSFKNINYFRWVTTAYNKVNDNSTSNNDFPLNELTDNTIKVLKKKSDDGSLYIVERIIKMRSQNKTILDFSVGLNLKQKIQAGKFFYKAGLPFLSYPILNGVKNTLVLLYKTSITNKDKIAALSRLVGVYSGLNYKKKQIDTLNKLIEIDKDRKERWEASKSAALFHPKAKNPEDIKQNHEELWGKTLNKITSSLEAGESPISIVLRHNVTAPSSSVHTPIGGAISSSFFEKYKVQPSSSGVYLSSVGCVDSRYGLVSRVAPTPMFISRFITKKTSAVVELGSGWGRNLFMLHYILGKKSKNLEYYALEYSDAGQEASAEMGKYIDDMNIKTGHIDYLNPDLSVLPKINGDILFFSNFSVEQVEYIGTGIFDQMLSLDNDFTVIHFEPIGWQKNKEFVQKRKNNDVAFFDDLVEKRLDDVYGGDAVGINAAINSRRQRYNIDMLEVLQELEKQNKIKIQDIAYDYSPPNGPHNPGTLIVWKPVKN